ncbi:hypothetical protein MTO96_016930 [Rhipicephalus appendiculatus]
MRASDGGGLPAVIDGAVAFEEGLDVSCFLVSACCPACFTTSDHTTEEAWVIFIPLEKVKAHILPIVYLFNAEVF